MQLNNIKCLNTGTQNNSKLSIKSKLTVASCALLQAAAPVAEAETGDWELDTAFLYYSEADGRVSIFEPVATIQKEISEDEFVKFKVVYDVLTGSTPYGALPTKSAQTITNPSGNSNITTPAGEVPLNDSFRDTRVALSADWTLPIDRLKRVTFGGNFSNEFDFTSFTGSATYAQDTSDRNRTYTVGLGFTSDTWDPVGGKNPELEFMIDGNFDQGAKGGTDTKSTTDIMLGLTQVINRSTIMQFNLGISDSSGYLTDPYRFISVVDANGAPTTALDADVPANAFPYRYEKRPDARTKNTFFWRTVHHLTEDVINVSYRYYTDDWGIDSHTLDFRYRYELGGNHYLQPHFRYYTQTNADFFVNYLVAGDALPDFASSDYRLSEFVGTTIGLKYGMVMSNNSEFTVRAELMNQSYNVKDEVLPEQQGLDISPDLNAVIFQVGYNFYW
ncbi:hypothetical protein MNBD_GAMMA08-935 [hydrothermal vent metagenome]|uniref:DUF3570 domain-containing protein n=1 Tax=hydrothermal vent metagenome TaxID=652676 RepID=A0A3B0XSM4_9ZZZZ